MVIEALGAELPNWKRNFRHIIRSVVVTDRLQTTSVKGVSKLQLKDCLSNLETSISTQVFQEHTWAKYSPESVQGPS